MEGVLVLFRLRLMIHSRYIQHRVWTVTWKSVDARQNRESKNAVITVVTASLVASTGCGLGRAIFEVRPPVMGKVRWMFVNSMTRKARG